jgi:hypothetical protein
MKNHAELKGQASQVNISDRVLVRGRRLLTSGSTGLAISKSVINRGNCSPVTLGVMPHRFGKLIRVMSQNNQSQNQSRDVDRIIEGVRQIFPEMNIEQLKVTHHGDDDGLWFFNLPDNPKDEIQIESSYGNCPFLIENIRNDDRKNGETIEQVVAIICEYFREGQENASSEGKA